MANHKSAAKRARQEIKKRDRNLRTKRTIRTFEKKLRTAIADSKLEDAEGLLKSFTSKIAKAAEKGILHKNNAARKVGRLASKVSSLK